MQNLNDMVSSENYLDSFKAIADLVLNKSKLVVKDREFEITEIEFYYTDDEHKDPFTDMDGLQQTSNKWYVPHSGGRVDITCGNEKAFGGILIRGIKEIGTGIYIDGPSNVLNVILRNALADIENCCVRLESRDFMGKQIYQGPRIGLRPNINDEFLVKPYRFVVDINPSHNFKEKAEVDLYTCKLDPTLLPTYNFQGALNTLRQARLTDKNQQIRRGRIISYLDN